MRADTEKWLDEEVALAADSQKGFGQSIWGTLVALATVLWLAANEFTKPIHTELVFPIFLTLLFLYDVLEAFYLLIFQPVQKPFSSPNRYQSVVANPFPQRETLVFILVRYGVSLVLAERSGLVSSTARIYLSVVICIVSLLFLITRFFSDVRSNAGETKQPQLPICCVAGISFYAAYSTFRNVLPVGFSSYMAVTELKIATLLSVALWLVGHALKQRRAQLLFENLTALRRAMRGLELEDSSVRAKLQSLFFGVTPEAYYAELERKQLENLTIRFNDVRFSLVQLRRASEWKVAGLLVPAWHIRKKVWLWRMKLSQKRLAFALKMLSFPASRFVPLEKIHPELASRGEVRRKKLDQLCENCLNDIAGTSRTWAPRQGQVPPNTANIVIPENPANETETNFLVKGLTKHISTAPDREMMWD